jgi:hypothetical protein
MAAAPREASDTVVGVDVRDSADGVQEQNADAVRHGGSADSQRTTGSGRRTGDRSDRGGRGIGGGGGGGGGGGDDDDSEEETVGLLGSTNRESSRSPGARGGGSSSGGGGGGGGDGRLRDQRRSSRRQPSDDDERRVRRGRRNRSRGEDQDGDDEETVAVDAARSVSSALRWARTFILWILFCLVAMIVAAHLYLNPIYAGPRRPDDGTSSGTYPMKHNPHDIFREYRLFRLPGGLDVACVYDPQAAKAAASMNVRAGSFQDPHDAPGLAHFTEHMLFLGTKGFPDEGEYNAFLAANDGGDNAFTGDEDTNYFLHVAPSALPGALDRFSRFFREPLISATAVAREIAAVDSEFAGHRSSTAWHRQYLLKFLASPHHPFHRFATGNLDSLNHTDVRDRVQQFWWVAG